MVDEGNGNIFPGPKTFREVAPALGSSARSLKKTWFLCDFRTPGFKGIIYYLRMIFDSYLRFTFVHDMIC